MRASSLLRQLAKGGCAARRLSWVTPGFSQSRRCKTTASAKLACLQVVYLTEIGTDTAKEQIYNRFTLTPEGDEPLPGAVHFPNNPDIFDLTEAQQLTAEEQVEKWVDGRKKILWDSKKRRNEALDCFVYALAALRISISRWQLDLSALLDSRGSPFFSALNDIVSFLYVWYRFFFFFKKKGGTIQKKIL